MVRRRALPKLVFRLRVPEALVKSPRLHNQIVKEVVRKQLERHHQQRIPIHFKRVARSRYGYRKRTSRVGRLSYDAWKQRRWGSNRDLVKTGRSERTMTKNKTITVGGSATQGNIKGTLKLRFPFAGGTGNVKRGGARGKQGVTIATMVLEVRKIIPEEANEISRAIETEYAAEIVRRLKRGSRIRLL